jgi:hypothetical protein
VRGNRLGIVALALMGIVTGVVLSHVLQAGPKASLEAEHYLRAQQTLYQNYRGTVGLIEAVSLIVLGVIAWSDRKPEGQRLLSRVAFGGIITMFGIWAVGLNPINIMIGGWTVGTMSADWPEARDRWHQLHALRAGLACVALVALAVRLAFRMPTAEIAAERTHGWVATGQE